MNVDSLIIWAINMLILLDHGFSTPELDIDELKKYLGWLSRYRDDVAYWSRLVSIGVAARHVVRIEGIHMKIVDSFELAVSSVKMGSKELQFADQIIIFLSQQSKGIKLGECFIGSTEALESLFGKIKYMEHEQTSFGFTSLVLAAMACVGPTNEKIIEEAMISIKLSDVEEWAAKEIGQSVFVFDLLFLRCLSINMYSKHNDSFQWIDNRSLLHLEPEKINVMIIIIPCRFISKRIFFPPQGIFRGIFRLIDAFFIN